MKPVLSTVKQFCARHPAFNIGGERYKIFHEHENGLADLGVIVRDGRRVLIHESRYFTWLELKSAGQLESVRNILRKAKTEGRYLPAEEAVDQLRGRSDRSPSGAVKADTELDGREAHQVA